jgi:hypothetical protein
MNKPHDSAKDKPKYLIENHHHSGDAEAIVTYLTDMAASGWELVTVVGDVTFYFKAAK